MKTPARIDWPTLREWCLAHGAKNDRIVSIEIERASDVDFNVIFEGYELDDEGRPYQGSYRRMAMWRSTSPLRSLP